MGDNRKELVEITPEMIEAGDRELSLYSPREDSAEAVALILENIYRAMESARRR